MAGPANAIALVPQAAFTPVGVETIPLTLGSDVDLTVSTANGGQTRGYVARALLIGSTAGNVVFYDGLGNGPYTQAVAANQRLDTMVSYVVNSGTTAATISAIL